MNKKLIALALAALPAAAMADVTIYGTIKGGIESNKTYSSSLGFDSNGNPRSGVQVNDWISSIGFKGTEDLGSGLKAIWQVESRLHIDGTNGAANKASSDGFATRDSFLGLAGDSWGKFRFGRLSNYANSDMEQVDPGSYFGGYSDESVAGLGMFTRLDGRVNNALRYDSPNWAGFSFALLYGTDESRVTGTNGSRTNNQTWNLGLSYENSGFFGKYNYENWGDADQLASTKSWHRLEGGYNANNLYVALGYQQVEGYGFGSYYNSVLGAVANLAVLNAGATQAQINAAKLKTKEAAFTVGYSFGPLTPYFTYAKGYNASLNGTDISNSGYDQYLLSLNYAMSKRTSVYTSAGTVKWKGGISSENSFGLGLIHSF
ncbi:porin [Chromobacterium sp. ATCC 53434]|uniref:porin n=1 Tax=Chromobacterium sp. (strain ATCC 53434 / SC 14030) TaxID=2059672 RepID=UPI000C7925D5|nr:porin [Chromobacterium sp. ATCC 53434]AUH49713.1 porin [Chromobacterium sp. ATCC 53434]